MPAPPIPNTLSDGVSTLCPNHFNKIDSAAWDEATGQSPWHQNCTEFTGGQIPPHESSVLRDFYNFTNGDNWVNNDGWMGPEGTECDWYGVTCDADGQHVIKLDLSYNNLWGQIPYNLQELSPQLIHQTASFTLSQAGFDGFWSPSLQVRLDGGSGWH